MRRRDDGDDDSLPVMVTRPMVSMMQSGHQGGTRV
jgi:hypothetical protein